MKILCTICARGGSKRLPGKNIKLFAGTPLIQHTLKHATSYGFDDIVVTSDCDEILSAARSKHKFMKRKRPESLATDIAHKVDTISDAVDFAESKTGKVYDIIVDLAVTSPLRLVRDIRHSIFMLNPTCTNVVSVSYQSFIVDRNKNDDLVYRKGYILNGAINIWRRDFLDRSILEFLNDNTSYYTMPKIRSIDIDTEEDFKLAELIYEKGLHRN